MRRPLGESDGVIREIDAAVVSLLEDGLNGHSRGRLGVTLRTLDCSAGGELTVCERYLRARDEPSLLHLSRKPEPGHLPVGVGRASRDADDTRGLLGRQPGKCA